MSVGKVVRAEGGALDRRVFACDACGHEGIVDLPGRDGCQQATTDDQSLQNRRFERSVGGESLELSGGQTGPAEETAKRRVRHRWIGVKSRELEVLLELDIGEG